MKSTKSALLVANGEFQPNLEALLAEDNFLIAVDGGLRHLLALNHYPHLLLGDLDSITLQEMQASDEQGVEILRFQPQKDESDLELALLEAIKRGYSQLSITNAAGGRIDHLLGNLSLLFHPVLKLASLKIITQASTIHPLVGSITLPTQPGDLISLIPWQGEAFGVITQGLAYPLHAETLLPYETRGISNVALGNQITVQIQSGKLLVIHTPIQGKETPCPKN